MRELENWIMKTRTKGGEGENEIREQIIDEEEIAEQGGRKRNAYIQIKMITGEVEEKRNRKKRGKKTNEKYTHSKMKTGRWKRTPIKR